MRKLFLLLAAALTAVLFVVSANVSAGPSATVPSEQSANSATREDSPMLVGEDACGGTCYVCYAWGEEKGDCVKWSKDGRCLKWETVRCCQGATNKCCSQGGSQEVRMCKQQ
ncbi:MAG: hypothetical protein HY437_02590 [Candidatus Magasanikbacteria bacterium]|nr:hypothetical protein [Candidatus Magasanikbacteria bacterium]